MAFVVTSRGVADSGTTDQATISLSAFTPNANSLGLFFGHAENNNAGDVDPTASDPTGITPTLIAKLDGATAVSNSFQVTAGAWRWAPGGSPASTTISWDGSSTSNAWYTAGALDITGHDTSTPVAQSKTASTDHVGGASDPSQAVTFDNALVTGNLVVVAFSASVDPVGSGDMAAPTIGGQSMTKLQGSAPNDYEQHVIYYREITGAESNRTITCAGVAGTGGTAYKAVAIAVEVAAAGSTITGSGAPTQAAQTSSGAGTAPVFPTIESVAETAVSTAGTSHAITLPSGITATDLVLILMDIGSTSATLNALTDWGEILDESAANGLKILWFTGSGVPSNPTFTSSASTRSASIALRISGADKSITPQIGTTATGTSATPDPPSVTPTGGIAKNYLFIAMAGMAGEEADDDTWANTPPTNYLPNPPYQKSCGTAGTNLGGLITVAARQLNTGSAENPGTFGVDVSAAWRAQTIIVHPSSPSGTGTPSQAAQTASGAGYMQPTGAGTPTQAAHTSSGAGTVTVTGTGTPSQAAQTSSGSGTAGSSPTGTGTPTQAAQTAAGSGALQISGSGAPTQAAQTAAGAGLAVVGAFATSIDSTNDRILDQHGQPWFGVGDTPWSVVAAITTSDQISYLDDVAALGFNFVLFSAPEPHYTDNSPRWRNEHGELPFTGTNFASSLNDAYWDDVEEFVAHAAELGITCLIVPQYGGYQQGDGWEDAVVSAYGTPSNLTTYGQALAARFNGYPNIVWMLGHDDIYPADFYAASDLIGQALASGTPHLIAFGGWHTDNDNDASSWSTGDTDWDPNVTVASDFDTLYSYTSNPGENAATVLAAGKAFIYLEGWYEQSGVAGTGVGGVLLREQMWEPLMAGASGSLFGAYPRWHFDTYADGTTNTWQESLTDAAWNDGTVHAGYLSAFLAAVPDVLTSTPDTTATFLTSGAGFARFSTSVGVVYKSGTGSITLDTTELAGSGNVRIRRYDPTNGTFTTLASSEAQNSARSITHPGNNSAGAGDYVYVVDLTDGASGTGTPTQGAQTASGAGTITYTGAGTPAQAAQTSTGVGTVTFTATGAPSQAAQTSSGAGSEQLTASGTPSQLAHTSSGSGSVTFTATGTPLQAAQTSSGTGTVTFTGTGTPSQAVQTANGGGSVGSSPTGTGNATQAAHSGSGSGTVTLTIAGSGSPSQAAHTCIGIGANGNIQLVLGAAWRSSEPSAVRGREPSSWRWRDRTPIGGTRE